MTTVFPSRQQLLRLVRKSPNGHPDNFELESSTGSFIQHLNSQHGHALTQSEYIANNDTWYRVT